jgi:hypothetical protein
MLIEDYKQEHNQKLKLIKANYICKNFLTPTGSYELNFSNEDNPALDHTLIKVGIFNTVEKIHDCLKSCLVFLNSIQDRLGEESRIDILKIFKDLIKTIHTISNLVQDSFFDIKLTSIESNFEIKIIESLELTSDTIKKFKDEIIKYDLNDKKYFALKKIHVLFIKHQNKKTISCNLSFQSPLLSKDKTGKISLEFFQNSGRIFPFNPTSDNIFSNPVQFLQWLKQIKEFIPDFKDIMSESKNNLKIVKSFSNFKSEILKYLFDDLEDIIGTSLINESMSFEDYLLSVSIDKQKKEELRKSLKKFNSSFYVKAKGVGFKFSPKKE